ncbi:hypothetical protein [Desulfurivibrio sp. C05AmB]|uniref:hypothetical protein n=1 Tax=Desulfurivibrio sp. C05AmB TaxID=3374371 RepID=UPI00376F4216
MARLNIKSKNPYKDRKYLLRDINSFISRNGGVFNQLAKRMSDLFEMSIYNDIVKYYKRKKYDIEVMLLGKDGTFRYKLTTSGLKENFSYFHCVKSTVKKRKRTKIEIEIHHNLKVQSAHDDHIYYTADICVCYKDGVITRKQKNGRNHSYVENDKLINFFEVKNLNPFPEVLFGFSGLVLEVMPQFINGITKPCSDGDHLTPSIVFSGLGGEHVRKVSNSLTARYGYNVISGLYAHKNQIYSFKDLSEYST